jgi:hypothetical protein
LKRHWPVIGVLASICVFVAAALSFRADVGEAAGYDWARHYISTLFVTGGSTARSLAIAAMLLLCGSLSLVFAGISKKAPSAGLRKGIAIGGIGSMVYAFLAVVTPMHDLLVTIALMFFLVATVATLQMLGRARRTALLIAGLACLASLMYCALIYYGGIHIDLLAVTQKLTFALCVSWLMAMHLALTSGHAAA